jgi:hypothetical protein
MPHRLQEDESDVRPHDGKITGEHRIAAAQERLILARFPRVTLMLDGDDSGRRATARIAAQLAGKCALRLVPVAKQAGSIKRPAASRPS